MNKKPKKKQKKLSSKKRPKSKASPSKKKRAAPKGPPPSSKPRAPARDGRAVAKPTSATRLKAVSTGAGGRGAAAAVAPALERASTIPVDVAEQEAMRSKFGLAPPEWTKVLDEREKAQTIPWGYGRDKVAAMPVDPERLFVYWEVTDEAIARAREALDAPSHDRDGAWLALRVYDVTGLLFDGTNAHHFFDVAIGRSDRQWFLDVNRPTSTVVVELGMLARNGAFAKIARSHRVDFPRREPSPPPPPESLEWMTVRPVPTPSGRPQLAIEQAGGRPWHGGSGRAARDDGGGAREGGGHQPGPRSEHWISGAPWTETRWFEVDASSFESSSEERRESTSFESWSGSESWSQQWELGASSSDSWESSGPVLEQQWESGPVAVEVGPEPAAVRTLAFEGVTIRETNGRFTRVRQGPWRIEIRGLDARAGGRVLARWEVRRTWVTASGHERVELHAIAERVGPGARAPGASESLGASERWLLGASERRWIVGSF